MSISVSSRAPAASPGIVASDPSFAGSGALVEGPRPARFPGRLLGAQDWHLVNRFSYGLSVELIKDVRAAGGGRAWFQQQLRPKRIDDPEAEATDRYWPSMWLPPKELWDRHHNGTEHGGHVADNYQRWVLVRRLKARRQLHEVMTEFWENHLHVTVVGDGQFAHRIGYGSMIRKHALGRFDAMLAEAITHPAMLIYLNGAESTKEHPNENLGRELLELHTVGVGNYTEREVVDSARILTGWTVDSWKSWEPLYREDWHDTGRVRVKGFRHANRSADGRTMAMAYLRHLAHHPQTAQRIARKLAVKFVSDEPSQALVDQLAKVYLRSGTDIKRVLSAMIETREFQRSAHQKVRTPSEDVLATYRVLGIKVGAPPADDGQFNNLGTTDLWYGAGRIGARPFGWAQPNGQPITNVEWSSPSRVLASFSHHEQLASTRWPNTAIEFRRPADWLPQESIRFDRFVDHLAQQLWHRGATARVQKACGLATGLPPGERITAEHRLVNSDLWRLLVVFLDSPLHLTR